MEETIKDLENLFKLGKKLKVPAYQRAYSWEEEQLNQFVSDMLEMKDKGGYYYGHFILEETNDSFEIIDGQQRLTTFILFLMVCKLFKPVNVENYTNNFETVDYDRAAFKMIQEKLSHINGQWKIADFELNTEQTLSIQRIIFALNYFRKLFKERESKLKLDSAEIDKYGKILVKAHISTHITDSKAVAVQIFELQNTRGIKLNLIEKVKSKLMKAVYLNAESEKKDGIISSIQENFAEIYRLEEATSSNAFRGELTLDDILLHHLRMVDDGTKLSAIDKNIFNSPSKHGDKEKSILSYLDTQINDKLSQSVVEYITLLTNNFKKSVELVGKELPEMDKQNRLIGDVLILDKSLSLEFFILLYHKDFREKIESNAVVRLWEKLLFTRNFHDKYYRLWYTDDFERLFQEIGNTKEEAVEDILNSYVKEGFRPDSMNDRKLPLTVSNYIEENRSKVLNEAFHWCSEKMVYLLYKYEIEQGAHLDKLREIMKKGRSVEHILPRAWQWEWIGEKNLNSISKKGTEMRGNVDKIMNGIGNLLLITPSENPSLSNSHPKEKYYKSCSGGSYDLHNENRNQWEDHNKWQELIANRGNNIFEFLKKFIE